MYKPDDLERHIVLYTKGWYKRTNLIDDLKVIIGKFCNIDVEYLYLDSVLYWTQKTYFEIFNKLQIENHFGDLFKYDKQYTPESFTLFICSRIANVRVYNDKEKLVLDLGEPDYSVLPKKEELVVINCKRCGNKIDDHMIENKSELCNDCASEVFYDSIE